ncbi:SO2930 family diheme c-type cytochrome [Marinoscillum sp.]|uniref:SO2930 family diheme c-type cytochrome n=1 Tax=Marinoscillum sp. TaxID=2024838 RepID=UPI003BAD5EC3
MKSVSLLLLILVVLGCENRRKKPVIEEVNLVGTVGLDQPERLSEWGLFMQPLKELSPGLGVVPYDLNAPLFSDYAQKARFVKVPDGTRATYDSSEVMSFPVETILIKNFYYANDLRESVGERRIIETRLLIHEPQGWNALTYVWNEEQTEALLEIAGKTVPMSWTDEAGVLKRVNYSVPNLVQCKSCHERSGQMSPIGPTARQLNQDYTYEAGVENQLDHWEEAGLLSGLPGGDHRPKLPVWDDERTGTLDLRARAWLETNCAHCHRAEGPAKNTGLYLTYNEIDQYKLGINKPPVAAGRGSGGLTYGIVPGKPDQSILVHRIESLDPGVMMPEVGRKMRDEEGISLIREWIAQMDGGRQL